MKKRLTELVEKKFLTSEEIDEIYSMVEVDKVEYNGYSGLYINYYWLTVYTVDGEEYDIYEV
ncbi:hypothetical protein [Clostridium sp.]|uniref:hypothetical protein n=1 Tax=Clostridium sp. TaxID=1506 RepID=UPI0025C5F852|nr:hypothetical protein [Clostridium sp.]